MVREYAVRWSRVCPEGQTYSTQAAKPMHVGVSRQCRLGCCASCFT
ncbi:2Fe-2S iron-sulfur cluster-binding protein [Streptomyces griseoloalbus]